MILSIHFVSKVEIDGWEFVDPTSMTQVLDVIKAAAYSVSSVNSLASPPPSLIAELNFACWNEIKFKELSWY